MKRMAALTLALVLAGLLGAPAALADPGRAAADGAREGRGRPEQVQALACPDGQVLAGQGCCSHHKGQCGCKDGRVVCCDGSLSPSCRCLKDSGRPQ